MRAYHVGVAIVNYKTASLVMKCLAALSNQVTTARFSVCVVDNASGDGSLEALIDEANKPEYCKWVKVIDGEKNGGFSFGNNLAAKYFSTLEVTHIWMLNPDTLPSEDALQQLLLAMEGSSSCFVAGSRLQDADGTKQIAAFNFPTPFGEFVNRLGMAWVEKLFPDRLVAAKLTEEPTPVDWVAGASMLISWEALAEVGFMDEGYFLYFEEVDLCMAIRRRGGRIMYVPQSVVIHYVGASTGISDQRKTPPRRPAYWFYSRRRFFQKNYGFFGGVSADVFWIIAYILFRSKVIITRRKITAPPHFLWDFIRNSSLVRGAIKK